MCPLGIRLSFGRTKKEHSDNRDALLIENFLPKTPSFLDKICFEYKFVKTLLIALLATLCFWAETPEKAFAAVNTQESGSTQKSTSTTSVGSADASTISDKTSESPSGTEKSSFRKQRIEFNVGGLENISFSASRMSSGRKRKESMRRRVIFDVDVADIFNSSDPDEENADDDEESEGEESEEEESGDEEED
ncbi:MAG: hypothetical protein LBO02_01245, partial [Holosporaceae bacterium]|nr:hypothetical protein [Holosporaceae bacterium]